MKNIIIILAIPLSILFFIIIGEFVIYVKDTIKVISCFGSRKHDSRHPGIVEKTIIGKWDIICPKCNCPYCKYVYVYDNEQISITEILSKKRDIRYYLNHSFISIIKEYIMESQIIEKYKCDNCEYIFD